MLIKGEREPKAGLLGWVGTLTAVALFIAVATAAQARGAERESGLVFRDQRPLSLSTGEEETTQAVSLCNASRGKATALRWSLGGFHFSKGTTAVKDKEVVTLTGKRTKLLAGACVSAKITVAAKPAISAGPFAGKLVVTSAGFGVARLDVDVAGPAATVVPTEGAAATVDLTATRSLPLSDSVTVNDGSAIALKAPPKGKSLGLAAKGAFIGNLVNGGDIASVFVAGDPERERVEGVWLLPIKVSGVDHVGDYEGSLTPTASADVKQAVKLKLGVTDCWVWAVLAVVLGAALAALPPLYIRRWRLESNLHDRHDELPDKYKSAEESFRKEFADLGDFKGPSQAAITAFTKATDKAIRAYAESTWYFDTTTDAYKKIVGSLDDAYADVSCLEEKDGLGKSLGDLKGALERLAKHLKEHLPVDRQPAIALAASALLRPTQLAVGEATIRTEKAKGFLKAIQRWTKLAQAVRRYEVWYRVFAEIGLPGGPKPLADLSVLSEIYALIEEARNELLDATDADAIDRLEIEKRLTHVYGHLAFLGGTHDVWVVEVPPGDAQEDDWPTLELRIDGVVTDIPDGVQAKMAILENQAPDDARELAAWRENADTLLISPAKPVELGQTKRFIGDAMVVVLSVTTGTIAALSAFYFGKTFGSVEDYLTVIFVGSAAQAFLKPVMDTLTQLRAGPAAPVTKSDPQTAAISVAEAVSGA